MELKILRKAERMCGGTGLKTKHSGGRNRESSEFQDSQGYIDKPCLKKETKQQQKQ